VTRWLVRALLLGGVALLALGALALLERGSDDDDEDAAIVAPSRLRATPAGEAVVELDSSDVRRLGLRLAPLATARAGGEQRLPAELVADPERVSAVRAPLAGKLSVPAGGRWPAFGSSVEAGSAVAQVSDALPLTLPRGGVVTRVGAQPGEMVEAGQLLLEITDYSRPVARVAWSAEAPAPPRRLTVAAPFPGGGERRVRAALLGPAAEADAVTRLPAFLYRAERGWPGARPGVAVTALLPAAEIGGAVLVPDSALVQWEGLVWAYARQSPGRYARRRVPTNRPASGGFLAQSGWAAGDSVVVRGAEQLLSEEFRARVTVGDEQGE
jgi:biotin carboxyl carrier protein